MQKTIKIGSNRETSRIWIEGHSETVLPAFRYFRNPEGDEWRMPITGEKGYLRERGKTLWEASCSKIANFIDADGSVAGQYMEFFPVEPIRHFASIHMEDGTVLKAESLDAPEASPTLQSDHAGIEPESPEDYNSRKQAEYNDDQVSS